MAKNKLSLEKAITFLNQKVIQKTWLVGQKLPSISSLAAEADVSFGTLWSAIDKLKKKGVLTGRQGSGIFYGTPEKQTAHTTKLSNKNRAEGVAQQISHDIIEGRFSEDEILPSCKELTYIYGLSFSTLKKSLNILVTSGRITVYKKRYKIVRHYFTQQFNRLVLIQGPDFIKLFDESYYKTRFYVFIHHLEKECSQRHFTLLCSTYTTRFSTTDTFEKANGFIVYLDQSLEKKAHDIFMFLLQFQKPVIFFNEMGRPLHIPPSRFMYECRIPDKRAGFQVGNFILDRGHKKVCFIGRTHTDLWSTARLEGVQNAFLANGLSTSSVTTLYDDVLRNDDTRKIHDTAADSTTEVFSKKERQNLQEIYNRSDKLLTDDYCRTMIFNRIKGVSYTLGLRFGFSAIFAQARFKSNATMWIVDDDNLAVFGAIEYCKRNRVRVPQDISIISFNNQIEALTSNLTSYGFNMPAIVGRMMDILFWPQKKHKGNENSIVEVEGFIAVRGSTGK